MTADEIIAWLKSNANGLPVCVVAPGYAGSMPAQVLRMEVVRDAKWLPSERDTLVAWSDIVLITAGIAGD
jgi:hypothetical protein